MQSRKRRRSPNLPSKRLIGETKISGVKTNGVAMRGTTIISTTELITEHSHDLTEETTMSHRIGLDFMMDLTGRIKTHSRSNGSTLLN